MINARGLKDHEARILVAIQDVTETLQFQADLRRSQARNMAILDSALDGIIIFDEQGHIEEFNPAAERTFGYTAAEVEELRKKGALD